MYTIIDKKTYSAMDYYNHLQFLAMDKKVIIIVGCVVGIIIICIIVFMGMYMCV